MVKRRTEVYSIPSFVNNGSPKRVEGGFPKVVKTLALVAGVAAVYTVFAAGMTDIYATDITTTTSSAVQPESPMHSVSRTFDTKIWPMFLDIGDPLAKTMMAIGIYQCIRGNVDKGWKTVYRSGIGLVGLYLISGAVHILQGVGQNLDNV